MPIQVPNQNNERDYFVVRLTAFQNQLGITDALYWEWRGIGLRGWFRARRPDTIVNNPRPGVIYAVTENYTLVSMENIKDAFFPDLGAEKFEGMTAEFRDYEAIPSVIFNMGVERPA